MTVSNATSRQNMTQRTKTKHTTRIRVQKSFQKSALIMIIRWSETNTDKTKGGKKRKNYNSDPERKLAPKIGIEKKKKSTTRSSSFAVASVG